MKFTSRVDIAAPAEVVFARITDVAAHERLARRKGVSLTRIDTLAEPGVGMSWQAEVPFRGRLREIEARITRFQPPESLSYEGDAQGFEFRTDIEVVALSKTRSRLHVTLEVKPRTLGARLLLQSAKLGRSSLEKKLDDRIASLGRSLESASVA